MSITMKFLKEFKPDNEEHVKWFRDMTLLAETMGDPEKASGLISEINKNPFNIKLDARDALDWPHIHFVLCGSYVRALFKGGAFII